MTSSSSQLCQRGEWCPAQESGRRRNRSASYMCAHSQSQLCPKRAVTCLLPERRGQLTVLPWQVLVDFAFFRLGHLMLKDLSTHQLGMFSASSNRMCKRSGVSFRIGPATLDVTENQCSFSFSTSLSQPYWLLSIFSHGYKKVVAVLDIPPSRKGERMRREQCQWHSVPFQRKQRLSWEYPQDDTSWTTMCWIIPWENNC